MPNLRIVNTNVADSATLSADEEAGALLVTNLQTDVKSEVWRSTTLNPTITAIWSSAQFVSMVAIPFANFSSTATIQIDGYTLVGDGAPAYTSTATLCCPTGTLSDLDWGAEILGANSLAYGGGVYAVVWIPVAAFEKITITILDSLNTETFVECGKLVIGNYWEADLNADYGTAITYEDRSKQARSDGGDLYSDRGVRHKKLTMSLTQMADDDRNNVTQLTLNNGKNKPFFISLYPDSTDIKEDQMHRLYGKLSTVKSISRAFFDRDSTSLTIEEV